MFNCRLMSHMCEQLGVPLAPVKCEGPTTCLTFLVIEIDKVAMELRLSAQKVAELCALVAEWRTNQSRTRKELESLTGHLQQAATVVRPGRTFLRRMCDLLSTTKRPQHHIPRRNGLRLDLAWWDTFLASWNGMSMLLPYRLTSPNMVLVSDASGRWGCGALWGTQWLQLRWEARWGVDSLSIAFKELVQVIIAAIIWGRRWRGLVVRCRSDNQATVAVINNRTSRDAAMTQLLRCLFFFEGAGGFCLTASYIPGPQNNLADDISRGRTVSFLSKIPWVRQDPARIHSSMLECYWVPNQTGHPRAGGDCSALF